MPARSLSRLRFVVPVVAALVASGCVAGPGAGIGPEPRRTAASAPTSQAIDGTTTVAEFRRDVNGATGLAERYWKRQFRASGATFRPVDEVIAYRRAGEVSCGGEPLALNNAAYCSDGDFIAYDVAWALAAFRQVGDAFIFYLVGHEYAHAVQLRLGIRKQFTIQQELQADCMAGAMLGDTVRAGDLELSAGDLDEFRSGLLAVGDDPGQPWFAEGAHGTAEQRTQAFTEGYDTSVDACELS